MSLEEEILAMEAQEKEQTLDKGPGFWERVKDVFTGNLRETTETQELSEIATSIGELEGSATSRMQAMAGILFAAGDKAREDIIQDAYPKAKFRDDAKGNRIMVAESGKEYLVNAPGFSFQDAASLMTDLLMFTPGSQLASASTKFLSKAGIGSAAAGATEWMRQKATQAIGSEQPVSATSVGLAAAGGGTAELIGSAAKSISKSKDIKALGQTMEEFMEGGAERIKKSDVLSKETDIGLFPAQKTESPTALQTQEAYLKEASPEAARRVVEQNEQAYAAVENFMARVAPGEAAGTASAKAAKGLGKMYEGAREAGAEAAKPWYKVAFQDPREHQLPETMELISKMKAKSSAAASPHKAAKKVEELLTPVEGGQLNTELIDTAKREMDALYKAPVTTEKTSEYGRALQEIKKVMLGEIKKENLAYKQALSKYSEKMKPLDVHKDTLVERLANLKGDGVYKTAQLIYGHNPATVKKTMDVIRDGDPKVADGLVREYMDALITKAKLDPSDIKGLDNVPKSLLTKSFGNPEQVKRLRASLTKEQNANLSAVLDALKRAASGRPHKTKVVSPDFTMPGIGGGIRRFIDRPKSWLAGLGEGAVRDHDMRVIGETIVNPKWKLDVRRLRKADPNSPKTAQMAQKLFDKISQSLRETGKPLIQAIRQEDE
jgi:hypothetical protein